MTLQDIKPGDIVLRMIGGTIPMELKVTEVTDDIISCGGRNGWNFNRTTGGEVDEDLGWDGINRTGSTIKPKS